MWGRERGKSSALAQQLELGTTEAKLISRTEGRDYDRYMFAAMNTLMLYYLTENVHLFICMYLEYLDLSGRRPRFRMQFQSPLGSFTARKWQ